MIEVESLENPLFSNFSLKPYFVQPSVLGAGRQHKQLRREGAARCHLRTVTARLRPYSPGAVTTFAVFQAGGPSLPTINFRGGFSSLSLPPRHAEEKEQTGDNSAELLAEISACLSGARQRSHRRSRGAC